LNVPGIVALGAACKLAREEMDDEAARLLAMRQRLLARLQSELDGVYLNGSAEQRLPGNLNLSFAGVMAHRLLASLTVLAVSSSSACSSAESAPSPVLTAIGVSADLAAASLRIGLGRTTTVEEVDFAAEKIVSTVRKLRRENPRYQPSQP
jgi:cysteine desulfurase